MEELFLAPADGHLDITGFLGLVHCTVCQTEQCFGDWIRFYRVARSWEDTYSIWFIINIQSHHWTT
jgi:hypothetical protein